MAGDWYRQETWDEAASVEFERRLARARSSRVQYLRIQGYTLTCSSSIADRRTGRTLLQRVIDEHPGDIEAVLAFEELGVSSAEDGDFVAAERALRVCLARCQEAGSKNNTSGVPELHLAQVLLATGDTDALSEACRLLAAVERDVNALSEFGQIVFQFLRACARAADRRDLACAGAYAHAALHVAEHGVPTFERYPWLGHASAGSEVLVELSSIVERYPRAVLPDSVATAFAVSGEPLVESEDDRQRAARLAQDELAVEPVMQQLRDVGVEADSLWDIDAMTPAAWPILIRALSRTDLPDSQRAGAARTIGGRDCLPYWGELLVILRALDPVASKRTKEGLAAALSDLATRSNIDDVIDLLRDPSIGPSRVCFLSTLTRLRIPQRWQLIHELRADPQLQVQADHMLHQKRLRDAKHTSAQHFALAIAIAAGIALGVTGCVGAGSARNPYGLPTKTIHAFVLEGTPASICRYFASTRVLDEARRLADQGVIAARSDVRTVRNDVESVLAVGPRYMHPALEDIDQQVGTAATLRIVPATKLLAGECRARGFPIPAFTH